MRISSERGSALIETLVAAPIVSVVILGGSLLMYRWFAEVWMTRAAREAAVCLATSAPASQCRRRLEATLRIGLPFGRAEIQEHRRRQSETKVKLSLDLALNLGFLKSFFKNRQASFGTESPLPRIEADVSFPRFENETRLSLSD